MKPGLKHLMCTACAIAIIPSMLMLVGNASSAASPYSADRRGSSGSHTRSDDKGVCADGGPHGLRLGVASRLCL